MPDPTADAPQNDGRPSRQHYRVVRGPLYWFALGFFVLVGVAHFSFWLGGVTRPIIVGLPPVFLYHAAYCLVAFVAVLLVFRAVWPPTED